MFEYFVYQHRTLKETRRLSREDKELRKTGGIFAKLKTLLRSRKNLTFAVFVSLAVLVLVARLFIKKRQAKLLAEATTRGLSNMKLL